MKKNMTKLALIFVCVFNLEMHAHVCRITYCAEAKREGENNFICMYASYKHIYKISFLWRKDAEYWCIHAQTLSLFFHLRLPLQYGITLTSRYSTKGLGQWTKWSGFLPFWRALRDRMYNCASGCIYTSLEYANLSQFCHLFCIRSWSLTIDA